MRPLRGELTCRERLSREIDCTSSDGVIKHNILTTKTGDRPTQETRRKVPKDVWRVFRSGAEKGWVSVLNWVCLREMHERVHHAICSRESSMKPGAPHRAFPGPRRSGEGKGGAQNVVEVEHFSLAVLTGCEPVDTLGLFCHTFSFSRLHRHARHVSS